MEMTEAQTVPSSLLGVAREDPGSLALFCDLDGTLAPIVERPDQVEVPAEALRALAAAADRFGICAVVTGRPVLDAKRIVGLDSIVYVGNHGIEVLDKGSTEVEIDPSLAGHEREAGTFIRSLDPDRLNAAGLRLEDKGPIVAIHWRGSDSDEASTLIDQLASEATVAGLKPHRGRMVLELRPDVTVDKGAAVKRLLGGTPEIGTAVFIGDDRTDLDAFRAIDDLVGDDDLSAGFKVSVLSSETSDLDLRDRADICLDDTRAVTRFLRELADSN